MPHPIVLGLRVLVTVIFTLSVPVIFYPVSAFGDAASVSKQKALLRGWEDCLIGFASKVAWESKEPANAIVRASFVSCSTHEDALYLFFEQQMTENLNKNIAEDNLQFLITVFFPAIKKDYGDKVLATVLILRSN